VYHSHHGRKMKIAFDEWNATYSHGRDSSLHERYTLEDALVVAMFLNSFIRHADVVKMANIAQLVNIIPPIYTNPEGMFLQTIYYPYELYSTQNGAIALDAHCESKKFETRRYGNVPYLDVSATFDPTLRRISINIINRHETDIIPVTIENGYSELLDKGKMFVINGDHVQAINDFADKDRVKTEVQDISVPDNTFVIELPPHSVSMVQVIVK